MSSLALTGGGTDGNEQLTTITGLLLIVLLLVIGITILRISQLISVHLFVGFLLLGPMAVKLASTGYRFARYYTRDPTYRSKGAPKLILRMIAPVVVVSTLVVFASGVLLMLENPSRKGQMLLIHKVSFILWSLSTALHVAGHLPALGSAVRPASLARIGAGTVPGRAGRWITIIGSLVGGLVLAVILIPEFAPWTARSALMGRH